MPLFKTGKDDRSDPKNYRGISLTDTLGKIFEKILFDRIMFFLNDNDILSPLQYGGRKTVGATLQVMKAVNDIHQMR